MSAVISALPRASPATNGSARADREPVRLRLGEAAPELELVALELDERLARADHVAGGHPSRLDGARERGADLGVAEVRPGRGHRRLGLGALRGRHLELGGGGGALRRRGRGCAARAPRPRRGRSVRRRGAAQVGVGERDEELPLLHPLPLLTWTESTCAAIRVPTVARRAASTLAGDEVTAGRRLALDGANAPRRGGRDG